jgi:uncharacterized DUF497 family protein
MWDWDDDKRESNLAKHGVDFAAALAFEWEIKRYVDQI